MDTSIVKLCIIEVEEFKFQVHPTTELELGAFPKRLNCYADTITSQMNPILVRMLP